MYANRRPFTKRLSRAFTLVELLVVIAIIGVLVALLLPAIQAAREAARRNTCKNNLKQWALGCLNHESALGHFPTGGWGWKYVGDADRGTGGDQPGSWAYNVLPFIEQSALHALPSDGQPDVITPAQASGAFSLQQEAIDILNCPSRRTGAIAGTSNDFSYNSGTGGTSSSGSMVPSSPHTANGIPERMGRLDYAGNGGTTNDFNTEGPGPGWDRLVSSGTGNWITIGNLGILSADKGLTPDGDKQLMGIMFQRSKVGMRHIVDGASNTYLIGEKFLQPKMYESGRGNEDGDWVEGSSSSNLRSTIDQPIQDKDFADGGSSTSDEPISFGSAHPVAFHMAYGDGSVKSVNYSIDAKVHQYQADRADGNVIGN